ncbi:carbohydrate-binding domain-containing protein [Paenibacillus sp. JX-17]|uniref:Carbohydrate-binding domain-containing protein n=1 Tax=Paenibacillus lacisoli TaxID=3064525 RepID=A0ABT9CAL9_9BACL|nr:carbohydrate-binding domain-containing protein [Paenibacillus sp. JX-17]MDO7906286.1 carbohydrate-binding domain-containing protein [Paenibacillus sp. JX-17]
MKKLKPTKTMRQLMSNKGKMGVVLLCTAAMLSACGTTTNADSTAAAAAVAKTTNLVMGDLVTFDSTDTSTTWSQSSSTMIKLSGKTAAINGTGAAAANGKVTITKAGTYVVSGTLSEGQIVVNTSDEGLVHLVLNGANIHSSTSAPIYIKKADKAVITLQAGTKSTLSDGKNYVFDDTTKEEPDAAIFSKADLTINGTGKLAITANYKDGIRSKDDLKIAGGTIWIQSADDAIVGKDMVAVKSGTVTVKAGGDGIKSTNDEDAKKGFVAIAGGTFNIKAHNDGIQAETHLLLDGGTYTVATGGGSANAPVKMETMPGGFGGGGTPPAGERPALPPGVTAPADGSGETNTGAASGSSAAGTTTSSTAVPDAPPASTAQAGAAPTGTGTTTAAAADAETATESAKAIKAGTNLVIHGGTYTIDAMDDAVHSNSLILISGGTFDIRTGDDGVHADDALTIDGGTIGIKKSYEGLEANIITINDGKISVTASDDGVNASGGSEDTASTGADEASAAGSAADAGTTAPGPRPEGGSSNAQLILNGGVLNVDAGGDGLDANGSITMTGGTAIINGPTDDGNGPLDFDGDFNISGGTLVAAGSAGMAQAPSDTSGQRSIAMTFTAAQKAGTLIHVEDSEGNTIATFAPSKEFRSVVISSPVLKDGGTYTLYTGGSSTGSESDGWYEGGQYTGGTQVVQFQVEDSVTTWVNESGVTTANSGFGPGGGRRPEGVRSGDKDVPSTGTTSNESSTAVQGTVVESSTSTATDSK